MSETGLRVLYLIVARGGSKSVPKKNLQHVGGLSLIGFKARSAQRAGSCSRLIISTDDAEIQAEARCLGVEVPFIRPAELATDEATTDSVVAHAMEQVEREQGRDAYDALMLLEPSSPFARAGDYDAAVELMKRRRANVVVGMRDTEVNSVFTGPLDEDGRITTIIDKMASLKGLRRQDQKQERTMNGAFYLLRWDFFREHRARYMDRDNSYGLVMDRFHSIEVDEPVDLAWARFLVAEGHLDLSEWAPLNG